MDTVFRGRWTCPGLFETPGVGQAGKRFNVQLKLTFVITALMCLVP